MGGVEGLRLEVTINRAKKRQQEPKPSRSRRQWMERAPERLCMRKWASVLYASSFLSGICRKILITSKVQGREDTAREDQERSFGGMLCFGGCVVFGGVFWETGETTS